MACKRKTLNLKTLHYLHLDYNPKFGTFLCATTQTPQNGYNFIVLLNLNAVEINSLIAKCFLRKTVCMFVCLYTNETE